MKYVSFCFVDVDVVGIGAVVDVVVHGAVVVDFLNTEVSGVEPLDYSARSSGYPPGVSFVARNYSIDYRSELSLIDECFMHGSNKTGFSSYLSLSRIHAKGKKLEKREIWNQKLIKFQQRLSESSCDFA